jgi:hypothetical protein
MGEGAATFFQLLSAGPFRVWGHQARCILLLRAHYATTDLDAALRHAACFGALEHGAVQRILETRCSPRTLDEYVAEDTARRLEEKLGERRTIPRHLTEYDRLALVPPQGVKRFRGAAPTLLPAQASVRFAKLSTSLPAFASAPVVPHSSPREVSGSSPWSLQEAERDEVRRGLGVVVATHKEPGAPAHWMALSSSASHAADLWVFCVPTLLKVHPLVTPDDPLIFPAMRRSGSFTPRSMR